MRRNIIEPVWPLQTYRRSILAWQKATNSGAISSTCERGRSGVIIGVVLTCDRCLGVVISMIVVLYAHNNIRHSRIS